jgi:hypothetical protein
VRPNETAVHYDGDGAIARMERSTSERTGQSAAMERSVVVALDTARVGRGAEGDRQGRR